MMIQALMHAENSAGLRAALSALGGRLIHVLTPHLLVITVPDNVSASSISGAAIAEPGRLAGLERALAEAWIAKFGAVSNAAERIEGRAAEPIAWDAPGYTPPRRWRYREEPDAAEEDPGSQSTNTPTSVTLTGSVAVGILMVSGPAVAPEWTAVHGALIYVSVGTDQTVWGVNAANDLFWWNGTSWKERTGRLKQISAASTNVAWGVNARNEVFQRVGSARDNGSSWLRVPGSLKHVSAAEDGSVWGVNQDNEIFRWNGTGWDQVPGRLSQISVASAASVWGVNAGGMSSIGLAVAGCRWLGL